MIKYLTRKVSRCGNTYHYTSSHRHLTARASERLEEVVEKANLRLKPTAIIDDDHQKAIHRLTRSDKVKLGLFLPKPAFSTRLTKSKEREYLPDVTEKVYLQQREEMSTYIKILQNSMGWGDGDKSDRRVSLDSYINLIYKDIYARYLISRGIGVDWPGHYSQYGVVNEGLSQKEGNWKERREEEGRWRHERNGVS